MPRLFLKNTVTGKRYRILNKDPKTNELTLLGPSEKPFQMPYDKEWLKNNNYELEREE